jgi:hypothetical protein
MALQGLISIPAMAGLVLYEASVPFFRRALQNQIHILKKGEAWCKENGHEVSDLSKVTLEPDMFVSTKFIPIPIYLPCLAFGLLLDKHNNLCE